MADDPETTLGGTPRPPMQRTQTVKAQFAKMPPEKKRSKFLQFTVGVALIVFGWNMPHKWPTLPAWLSFGVVVVGIVAVGGEFVQYPAKRALALAGDVMDRVRGKAS